MSSTDFRDADQKWRTCCCHVKRAMYAAAITYFALGGVLIIIAGVIISKNQANVDVEAMEMLEAMCEEDINYCTEELDEYQNVGMVEIVGGALYIIAGIWLLLARKFQYSFVVARAKFLLWILVVLSALGAAGIAWLVIKNPPEVGIAIAITIGSGLHLIMNIWFLIIVKKYAKYFQAKKAELAGVSAYVNSIAVQHMPAQAGAQPGQQQYYP